jgi:hypothetical protein
MPNTLTWFSFFQTLNLMISVLSVLFIFLTILNICFSGLWVPVSIPLAVCHDLVRKFK